MEYLEGEELRMLLKREKVLSPERLVRMLSQIGASASPPRTIARSSTAISSPTTSSSAARRDGDSLKILDFGSVRDNSAGAKKLTVMGTTIGSPYYMSPEQAQAPPLARSPRRRVVDGRDRLRVPHRHGPLHRQQRAGDPRSRSSATSPRPPSEAGAHVPRPATLDPVMEDALAKNPDIRLPSRRRARRSHRPRLRPRRRPRRVGDRPRRRSSATRIRAGVRGAVARYEEERARVPDTSAMDAAFRTEDPVQGRLRRRPGGLLRRPGDGRPQGPAEVDFAAVGGAAILVGVVVALLLLAMTFRSRAACLLSAELPETPATRRWIIEALSWIFAPSCIDAGGGSSKPLVRSPVSHARGSSAEPTPVARSIAP